MTDKACSLNAVLLSLLLLLPFLPCCDKKSSEGERPAAASPDAGKQAGMISSRLAVISGSYESWGNVSFSNDGKQVFYTAKKGGEEFLITSSQEGEKRGPSYTSISWLVQSPDGKRAAFGGEKGGGKHLVIDHRELDDLYHEEVAPASFSPDGRLVVVEAGGFLQKKWSVLLADQEGVVYRSPVYPDTSRRSFFSPDGRLLVYELGDAKEKKQGRKSTVFFLDVPSRQIIKQVSSTDSRTGKFSFSADSSRVIFDIVEGGRPFLVLSDFVLNEARRTELPYPLAGQSVLSSDGSQALYSASRGAAMYLVSIPWASPDQRKEAGPYEAVMLPVFIPGSHTAACLAMKGGTWRIVIGHKEGAEYDGIGQEPLVFSSDGGQVAYAAMKNGKWHMIVSRSDSPAEAKEGPGYDMVVTPVFSPDNRRIAYRARKGPMENAKRFMVIADTGTGRVIREGPVGDEIWPPVWSSDGRTAAFGAREGRELWWRIEQVE